jgi:hypothetical protein
MFKRWLVIVGLWLARHGGWTPSIPILPDEVLASAKLITTQTEALPAGGEFKRREALRALMNRHPLTAIKDLALSIELALR